MEKLLPLLTACLLAQAHPTINDGVFVITGVRSCRAEDGFCVLGYDCTIDEDFLPDDQGGHCDGLRSSFTPSVHFTCCRYSTEKDVPYDTSTTTRAVVNDEVTATDHSIEVFKEEEVKPTSTTIPDKHIGNEPEKVNTTKSDIDGRLVSARKHRNNLLSGRTYEGETHKIDSSSEEEEEDTKWHLYNQVRNLGVNGDFTAHHEQKKIHNEVRHKLPSGSDHVQSYHNDLDENSAPDATKVTRNLKRRDGIRNLHKQEEKRPPVPPRDGNEILKPSPAYADTSDNENKVSNTVHKIYTILKDLNGTWNAPERLGVESVTGIGHFFNKVKNVLHGGNESDLLDVLGDSYTVTPMATVGKDQGAHAPHEDNVSPYHSSPDAESSTDSTTEALDVFYNATGLDDPWYTTESSTNTDGVMEDMEYSTTTFPDSARWEETTTHTVDEPTTEENETMRESICVGEHPKERDDDCWLVQMQESLTGNPICAGALLTKHLVVTSASCVIRVYETGAERVNIVGIHDAGVEHHVRDIIVHENYLSRRFHKARFDIGLIRVKPAMPAAACIACIAGPHFDLTSQRCHAVVLNNTISDADVGSKCRVHTTSSSGRSLTVCVSTTISPNNIPSGSPLVCSGLLTGVASPSSLELAFSPIPLSIDWLRSNGMMM